MLTAEIKQEVRRIIEAQTTGPLNKWKQLESFLFEKKVIYTSRPDAHSLCKQGW